MNVIERAMGRLGSQRIQSKNHSSEVPPGVVNDRAVQQAQRSAVGPPVTGELTRTLLQQGKVARLKKESLITGNGSRWDTSDEYRRIKRPLIDNAFGKAGIVVERGNLIMVTSSLEGEGKTFTSINLALSMAMERNYTVLLVDADMAKSDVSRLYGLDKHLGLMDLVLDDQLDVSQVLVRTDIPNLSVLPSGRRHVHATELLASANMSSLVNEMAERYPDRVLIFDSPPLLATTEAQVLTGLMGQIVLVIEAGSTPQHVVQEVLSTLDSSKAVGLVLNKTHRMSRLTPYGGYQRYEKSE